jgi:hypothetical protein
VRRTLRRLGVRDADLAADDRKIGVADDFETDREASPETRAGGDRTTILTSKEIDDETRFACLLFAVPHHVRLLGQGHQHRPRRERD